MSFRSLIHVHQCINKHALNPNPCLWMRLKSPHSASTCANPMRCELRERRLRVLQPSPTLGTRQTQLWGFFSPSSAFAKATSSGATFGGVTSSLVLRHHHRSELSADVGAPPSGCDRTVGRGVHPAAVGQGGPSALFACHRRVDLKRPVLAFDVVTS